MSVSSERNFLFGCIIRMEVMISLLLTLCVILTTAISNEGTCYNKFEYEFHVLQKLVAHESELSTLMQEVENFKQTLRSLKESRNQVAEKTRFGRTYIRWGRSKCPANATLVYEGYAAGSHFTHTGAAANYVCLPKDPNWDKYVDGHQTYGRIYGAEYETNYINDFRYLFNNDVPCALCRTSSTDVIMLPGKNVCYEDYELEYKGYLMTGAYVHAAASEYVCVDGNPEIINGTTEDNNGKLFYHVEGECGSLKCPPYVNGRELTCAVCSYFPN